MDACAEAGFPHPHVRPTMAGGTDITDASGMSVMGDDDSSLSSANTTDIEDLLVSPRKRRRGEETGKSSRPKTRTKAEAEAKTETETNGTKMRPSRATRNKSGAEADRAKAKPGASPTDKPEPKSKTRTKTAKTPATEKKTATTSPPPHWREVYDLVHAARLANPTAPVDTVGCAHLHRPASSPRDRRFQTLVALMLSSQTKDGVTAMTMERLHAELGKAAAVSKTEDEGNGEGGQEKIQDHGEQKAAHTSGKAEENAEPVDSGQEPGMAPPSALVLENMLAVSPTRLNALISAVGYHNQKTKYLKQTAAVLRDAHDFDIPSTAAGLMRLPGVGPKMAHLCVVSAWGRVDGIGVDVHVHRITNRWGWHQTQSPEQTRIALESWLPRELWAEINPMLVGFGQTVCLPVGRRCGECPLAGTDLCPSEDKGWVDRRKKA